MSTVAHELAHLGQDAFAENHCRPWISWLAEATAAWVENYVGGLGPDHPEKFAPYFFDRPKLSLETNEKTATPRQYGSYLFFQWLAKHKSSEAMGKIWEHSEDGGHPIDTTQAALQELGYAGGFEEAWKQFALAGPESDEAGRLVQAVGNAARRRDRSRSRVRGQWRQDVRRQPSPTCRPSTTGSTSASP